VINSNFGFTPLKEIWIGDCYPVSWYDHLPNEIADSFRKITEWTKEDTGKLQKFLESLGITVRRPVFESINNHLDAHDNLVKPPITPRDHYLVLDKTLYSLHNKLDKDPWQHSIDLYRSSGYDVQSPKDSAINCLSPPSIVRVGKDIFIDVESHSAMWGFVSEWLVETAKNYRVNICNTDGHSDGVFCPVGPGLIVSSHYKTDYSQSFPGWKTFKIPKNLTNITGRTWRVDDESVSNNKDFSQHILNAASDWVGNFNETVYEVNMLVIDQHNVVAMKEYPPLTEWLNLHHINVHCFDFRSRSFWDGGWHCLTLDIERDDSRDIDLFPERGDNGVYWRTN